jgi:hypothetical protein
MKHSIREAHPKGATWTLIMAISLVISSCASATEVSTAFPETKTSVPATATTVSTAAPAAAESAGEPTQGVQPLATSRGPELHATDPATVNLAAGQLQVVEFFRFT